MVFDFLTSLSVIITRSIHVAANVRPLCRNQIMFYFERFFFFFFGCGPFVVFIEFVTILLLFFGHPDQGSKHTPCFGRQSFNHWTTSVPDLLELTPKKVSFLS